MVLGGLLFTIDVFNLFCSLENYKMRSRGLDEADKGLLGDDLTELEQYLVDSQELIKIRGKVSL